MKRVGVNTEFPAEVHRERDDAATELVRQGHATAPRVPLDVERVLQARLPRLPEGISASRLAAAERANDR